MPSAMPGMRCASISASTKASMAANSSGRHRVAVRRNLGAAGAAGEVGAREDEHNQQHAHEHPRQRRAPADPTRRSAVRNRAVAPGLRPDRVEPSASGLWSPAGSLASSLPALSDGDLPQGHSRAARAEAGLPVETMTGFLVPRGSHGTCRAGGVASDSRSAHRTRCGLG